MIKLLVIDLFCGFGGVTYAMENCQEVKVIAAVNHDPEAIMCHAQNHPDVKQFNEDIRHLNLDELRLLIEAAKRKYPKAKLVIWASIECTNFSVAKGGKPRDADSRTLAEHLNRYVEGLNPDYLMIENVREFMSWGSLHEDGKPKHDKQGCDYFRWTNSIQALGYNYDYRILDAADYGAYTSRVRYFGIFAKYGLSMAFPRATHAKRNKIDSSGAAGMFANNLLPHKAVRDVLDLQDYGTSVFLTGRIKSEKTFLRIEAGIRKHITSTFVIQHNSGGDSSKCHTLNKPSPSVTTSPTLGLVTPMVMAYYGSSNHNTNNIDTPLRTITTKDRFALVTPSFISSSFGCPLLGQIRTRSISDAAPTITTQGRNALVSVQFVHSEYSGGGNYSSIGNPIGSILCTPKQNLVTLSSKQAALVIDTPAKEKLYNTMLQFGIEDVYMRMLNVGELMRVMGFPTSYKMPKSQTLAKKFIGNSVAVPVVEQLTKNLINYKSQTQ